MEIRIGDLDLTYKLLTKNNHEGEEWKNGNAGRNNPLDLRRVSYDPSDLPYPLENATLRFTRKCKDYSANLIINPNSENPIFLPDSFAISKELEKKGLSRRFQYIPMRDNLIGYFCENHKGIFIPTASVTDISNRGRLLSIGSYGSVSRSLGSLEGFQTELKEFEAIANLILNLIYTPFKEIQSLPSEVHLSF